MFAPDTGKSQSFRKFALFFPCESVDHANPRCKDYVPKAAKPPRVIDERRALEYVSRRDPPPGFEHWLEFAAENKCRTGSYTRIERDLEVSQRGVIRR